MRSDQWASAATAARGDAIAVAGFRRAPQAVLTLDHDWRITSASPTAGQLLDTGGPLEGADLWIELAADWTDRPVDELHDELLDGASHAEVLVHIGDAGGGERWMEVTVRRLPDLPPAGGFDVLLRDVTERVRTREALEAERDRRDAIVAHSSDAVMFFRPDCTIEWASPATTRLFGAPPEELVGRNGVELIHPDDRERAFLTFLSMEEPGSEARVEFRYIRPDGSERWIEEVATNLVDDPHVGFIVGNLRDVTERREAEEQIALQARLLDAVGQAVVAVDTEHRVLYWNDAATQLYGWTRSEAIGAPVQDLIRPADGWDQVAQEIMGRVRVGEPWTGEFWVVRRDGSSLPVMITDTPVYDAAGDLIAILGVSTDISERIRAERMQSHLSSIVETSSDAILSSTTSGVVTTWNAAAEALFGYTAEEIVGRPTSTLAPESQLEELRSLMGEVAAGGEVRDLETVRVRADGSLVDVSLSLSPIPDRQGNIVEISAILRDITHRRAAQAELEHRSLHDPLTGLPNRELLIRRLVSARRTATGHHQPVAVAFLDIDHFNLVNDSLGHQAGDRLLVGLADRLVESVPDSDTVGRIGGDEFVVIRPGCPPHEVSRFAEELRSCVERPLEIDGRPYFTTISVGVCSARADVDPAAVLDNADAAMYVAKERGRDRVEEFDDSIRERNERRLELANDLRWVIDRHQLRVVYQPVVSIADGSVKGFEALVRWQHPERGLVSPDEFIPAAEATGLIVPIGEWVLRRAVRQLAAWQRSTPEGRSLWMSVNLSGRQLEQPDLVATVHRCVAEAGLPARSLHLEVTESVLMDAGGQCFPTVRSLRSLGFHISVDDFGTGYSSLSYLKDLPVDTLKIDRSFVLGVAASRRDQSIVRAILDLASAMDLQVIAEGVEDAAQAAALERLGCGLGQGFLWARPQAPDRCWPAGDRTGVTT